MRVLAWTGVVAFGCWVIARICAEPLSGIDMCVAGLLVIGVIWLADLDGFDEEVAGLARDIADVNAVALVESCSVAEEIDGVEWRDLSDREFDYLAELEDELRYLELRGKLERHPTRVRCVRLIAAG
jgi:hypothetical protein